MNAFTPASTEPFVLGFVLGRQFNAVVSPGTLQSRSTIPFLSLTVEAAYPDITWEVTEGEDMVGLVFLKTRRKLNELIQHFFKEALEAKDIGWRFECCSPEIATRQTVHFHLEIGHKDAFSPERLQRSARALMEA